MTTTDLIKRSLERAYQGKMFWNSALKMYGKLSPEQKALADEGATRYINACEKNDIQIESAPIREMIMDAADNRQIWKESDRQFLTAIGEESKTAFKARLVLQD